MTSTDALSANNAVRTNYSYDGPHTPLKTGSAMDAAAYLLRYANNATRTTAGLGSAPETHIIVDNLTVAATRMPQLLGQLQKHVQSMVDNLGPELRSDDDTAASEHAHAAVYALIRAAQSAEDLRAHLDHAAQPLSHLYYERPDR